MSFILDLWDEDKGAACRFTRFPDGQPHCVLDSERIVQGVQNQDTLHVNTRLRSPADIVNACLALDALNALLSHHTLSPKVVLNIGYLLGARMDRPIAPGQPATLHVLAALLNTCKAHTIRVLDPHSHVSIEVLNGASALHPDLFVKEVLGQMQERYGRLPVVTVPDKGAVPRTMGILSRLGWKEPVATCSKKRDANTGKLSGFSLETGDVKGAHCLIVDDICDGGGTFSGIAGVLREHGAESVHLAVTHGIFSKGIVIQNIDSIYATDSYGLPEAPEFERVQSDGVVAYQRANEVHPRLWVWTQFLGRLTRDQGTKD
jgi:ribose-phosphate pyrophosphokinase